MALLCCSPQQTVHWAPYSSQKPQNNTSSSPGTAPAAWLRVPLPSGAPKSHLKPRGPTGWGQDPPEVEPGVKPQGQGWHWAPPLGGLSREQTVLRGCWSSVSPQLILGGGVWGVCGCQLSPGSRTREPGVSVGLCSDRHQPPGLPGVVLCLKGNCSSSEREKET